MGHRAPNLPFFMRNLFGRTKRRKASDHTVQQVSLQELNEYLNSLAELFPQHDASRLREQLLQSSEESRLYVAADAMLQEPVRKSKLNYRSSKRLESWELFCANRYTRAVENLLREEFHTLSHSTIKNVMTENNSHYLRSRETLRGISSKSWRIKFRSWFLRQPPSFVLPDILERSTGSNRLDDEIYGLGKPQRDALSEQDEIFARKLNELEATEAQALFECECCFSDCTWEDIVTCTNFHFICRGCITHSVSEALFGQGGSLLLEKTTVRCISATAKPECDGYISPQLLPHLLPSEIYDQVQSYFIRSQLQQAGLPLVFCPGCSYAAIQPDQPHLIARKKAIMTSLVGLIVFEWYLSQIPYFIGWLFVVPFFILLLVEAFYYLRGKTQDNPIHQAFSFAVDRVRRKGVKQYNRIFRCPNPGCGISSCLACGKEWIGFHNCEEENATENRRLYIERVMTEAVKRTCPKCSTSFLKSSGCNMLTCRCGYQMCYLCRHDLTSIGYSHFCPHFRITPAQDCEECDKCFLYRNENEDEVARIAGRRAAEEWDERNRSGRRPAGWQENIPTVEPFEARLETALDRLLVDIVEYFFELPSDS